jgi:hypothetical protein
MAAPRKGLSESSYIEGQNLVIEYRWGEGRDDWLRALAADLAQRQVDVIVSGREPGQHTCGIKATAKTHGRTPVGKCTRVLQHNRGQERTSQWEGVTSAVDRHGPVDAADVTSSVITLKPASVHGPNEVTIATSVASRPRAIRMRPMRGLLWRASHVYQRSPR